MPDDELTRMIADWKDAAPYGVLGYLVGRRNSAAGIASGVTHTTLMTLDEASREARAHGAGWVPVEVREVAP